MLNSLVLLGILSTTSVVDDPVADDLSFTDALLQGDFSFDVRARYEDVSQKLPQQEKGAQASTLRSRVSYHTAHYNFLSAYIEMSNTLAIPDDDNYFDGSNAEFDDALIADPESTEWTQYWLGFDVSNTELRYGRQFVELDNGRFIGGDDMRQQRSTFSGLTLQNESLDLLKVRLGRLNRFESSLGDDVPGGDKSLDAGYFNLEYRGIIHSLLSIYVYDLDADASLSAWGSQTQGLRFAGHIKNEPAIEYGLEYAVQRDAGQNPVNYSATYFLVEAGATYSGIRVMVGQEVLGADGKGFFVTPLASLSSFQGWSDQFSNGGLGNIAGGVVDTYYSLGLILSDDFRLIATLHDFESDDDAQGKGALGEEWNIEALYQWGYLGVSLRYADYQRQNFGIDTRKAWLSLTASF